MDGLSLLCNLHSDGPLALRRLRAAGVRVLSDLEGVPESTLSACLRSSAAHARRFVVEARQLALRLAESPLEPEPDAEADVGADEAAEHAEHAEPRPPSPWLARGASSVARVPAGEHALEPEALEGLDARTCERLAREGVRTLEALQERADLALARSAGIALPRLLDLAVLARLAAQPSGERGAAHERAHERAHEVVPEITRRSLPWAGRSSAPPGSADPAPARARAADPGVAGPFG